MFWLIDFISGTCIFPNKPSFGTIEEKETMLSPNVSEIDKFDKDIVSYWLYRMNIPSDSLCIYSVRGRFEVHFADVRFDTFAITKALKATELYQKH